MLTTKKHPPSHSHQAPSRRGLQHNKKKIHGKVQKKKEETIETKPRGEWMNGNKGRDGKKRAKGKGRRIWNQARKHNSDVYHSSLEVEFNLSLLVVGEAVL